MVALRKQNVYELEAEGIKARIKERSAIEADVIARAMTDEIFRQELLADPRAVLERELGAMIGKSVKLPGDFKVTVIEESSSSAVIVLPARVPSLVRGAGPTDAELDPNGGLTYYCTTITCKPGFSC